MNDNIILILWILKNFGIYLPINYALKLTTKYLYLKIIKTIKVVGR